MIYMDNAATTMHKPQEVIDAVVSAMSSMGNAGRGANEASLSASRVIYDARERLCRLFGAEDPRQIAFTSNSTESLNIAIKGLLEPGDHVVATMLEHNSVLRPLYEMEKRGVKLTIVKSNKKGTLDVKDMEEAITPATKAVICTNASNLTGNYVDVAEIGEMAHRHSVLFVVDASQTAGVFPIDVQKMHIDVLCFTGHKGLLGPQGTGGLYVREGLVLRPLKCGGTGIQTYSKLQPSVNFRSLPRDSLSSSCLFLSYSKGTTMSKIRLICFCPYTIRKSWIVTFSSSTAKISAALRFA